MRFNKLFFILLIPSLLVGLFSITACGNQHAKRSAAIIDKDSLVLVPELGLMMHSGTPFSGIAVQKTPSGQVMEKCIYEQGKRNGLLQKWFGNGLLSYEAHYQEGKLHGGVKTWWVNGKQRSHSNYEHGVLHGEQWQWYTSGAKFKKRMLNMGREEGLQQCWRENGKIYNNYEAKNGRIFGLKRANLCYTLDNEIVQIDTD